MFRKRPTPEITDPITQESRNEIVEVLLLAKEKVHHIDEERAELDQLLSEQKINHDAFDDATQFLEVGRKEAVRERDALLARIDYVNSGLAKIALSRK